MISISVCIVDCIILSYPGSTYNPIMLTVLYNCNRLQSLRATYCAWVPDQVKTTQYSSFIISIIIIQCNLVKVLHQARDHDLLLPTPNIYIYYEQGSTRTQATPWRDQDNVWKILNLNNFVFLFEKNVISRKILFF